MFDSLFWETFAQGKKVFNDRRARNILLNIGDLKTVRSFDSLNM